MSIYLSFHYYLFTWKNFCLLLSSFLEMFFSCSLLCVLPLDVSIYVLFLPRPWKCTCPLLYFTWKCICPIVYSYLMIYLSVVVFNCLLLLLFFFYLKICLSVGYPSHRNICWKHSSTAGKTQPYVPMGLHMGLKNHMSRIKFPEQMKPPVRIQTGMVGERFAGGGRLRKESIGGIRL